MAYESYNSPQPREEIEALNQSVAEAVNRAAYELCTNIISSTYKAVEIYLQTDKAMLERLVEDGHPTGAVREYHVQQDSFVAPHPNGQFVNTFSIRLEPNDERAISQSMKLHVPVGQLRIREFRMPPLEDMEEIYVETSDDEGNASLFVVNKLGVVYEHIASSGDEDDNEAALDMGIWQILDNKVSDDIITIAKLAQPFTNWKTVAQRVTPIGDDYLRS